MSEKYIVDRIAAPLMVTSLTEQLRACGLAEGQTVLVHLAMSKLGWIIGGAEATLGPRARYRIEGAAWGAPIQYVEVKIDNDPWQRAQLAPGQHSEYTWSFWTFDWANPAPGEHSITTRAVDTDGQVQPAQDDPLIANKITYWESNGQITRRVEIPE